MSKKALFIIPLSVGLLSICSCSWLFNTKENYIEKQNPIKFLNKTNIGGNYIEYNTYTFNGDIVNKVMFKADDAEYLYTKDTPKLSDTYFTLHIRHSMFLGYGYYEISFYENGYATTSRYDRNQGKDLTYYYQFDEDIAKSVCDLVDNEYQSVKEEERRVQEERDRVEAEYNQMIEDMTIFTVIEKMKEEERVDLEFSFLTNEEDPRYYDFTFRDDGSIYTSLKNATYSESDHYTYIDEYDSLNHLFIQGNEWKIEIHKKARTVHVTFETHDKYGRSYKYDDDKIIDEDSLNAILNKAYELSAPKNPFGNSSSNPSSSSEE